MALKLLNFRYFSSLKEILKLSIKNSNGAPCSWYSKKYTKESNCETCNWKILWKHSQHLLGVWNPFSKKKPVFSKNGSTFLSKFLQIFVMNFKEALIENIFEYIHIISETWNDWDQWKSQAKLSTKVHHWYFEIKVCYLWMEHMLSYFFRTSQKLQFPTL